jgi:geranylgeranyl diphosphate synthase, type II
VSPAVPAIDAYLNGLREEVEAALERVLARSAAPRVIAEPIRYSLIAPGKRLRPCLTLAAAESVADTVGLAHDTARALALPAACAVEMIHSYSLVHDDLPAMDNDALRRGRPTTHVVYGDGLAILAGDGLLTDAFDVLATSPSPATPAGGVSAPADRRIRAVAVLAHAAGATGMVGGQAIDLNAVGQAGAASHTMDATALEDMHLRKTGALIRAASSMGAILAGGSDAAIEAIDAYAREIGLAFQIVDDVLDVEGSKEALGKTAGKDAAAGKPTFPAIYGLAQSKAMAAACVDRARAALAREGLAGRLGEIAEWSLGRKK